MAVPKFFEFFVPTLKALDECSPSNVKRLRQVIADDIGLTEEDKAEMVPSNKQQTYVNRIHWAIQYLKNAGLIEHVSRATYGITEEGRRAYRQDAAQINLQYLDRYESFRAFHGGHSSPGNPETIQPEETTPLEAIGSAYAIIRSELSKTLLQAIMDCTPDFFERLVVDLLIAMGYGYDAADAGRVVGKSGDEGIDGIISEDKLGFSHVYVQAKRWDSGHTVGRPEVQAFAGALLGKGASKGLFITTSSFSDKAKAYAAEQTTIRIVLVDGMELAALMMDFNVGVSTQKTYAIKQIDMDYFDEQ